MPRPVDPGRIAIRKACDEFRAAQPTLNDGRRRDGYDFAALFAEVAIRQAMQAIHTWGRQWTAMVDRQTQDDNGRAYRTMLRHAILACEWVDEIETEPPLLTFADACGTLGCRPEATRDVVIYRGVPGAALLWLRALAGIEECCRTRPQAAAHRPQKRRPPRRPKAALVPVPSLAEMERMRKATRAGWHIPPVDREHIILQLRAAVRSPSDRLSEFAADTWQLIRSRAAALERREGTPQSAAQHPL